MTIYEKLAEARLELQKRGVKQSGANTFSKYTYFELKDFLPTINEIFAEKKMCGVVSFTASMATLTIYDSESDGKIEFTSPMAEAKLKGCHEIQNLGAVETYQRRYLYITALEISEHDVLDEIHGDEKTIEQNKNNQQNKEQSAVEPEVVLNGYRTAINAATTLETVETYKSAILIKLDGYPNELKQAIEIYNKRKKEIQGA